MAGLVHDHGARKDEHVVLPPGHLDAIGIRQREPALRDRRHLATAAREHVLVVEDLALRLQIVGARA